jgi:hypothetical protein
LKFDVVIAHYRENLAWIRSLKHPSVRKVFVYTKGPVVTDLSSEMVEHSYLPNVGRESHTYLWHCVHNFHRIQSGEMGDFTFFVQGSPHSMNSPKICEWIEEVERLGLSFTLNYRMSSPYDFLASGRCRSWAGETSPADCDVKGWCEKHVSKDADFSSMPIFWNACFGVSSDRIVASDRSRMAHIQQVELSTLNPECGHFCERLWYHIFRMESARPHEVDESLWDFWGGPDGRRHYGVVRLREDGTVGLYENFNERRWKRESDSILMMDERGSLTSDLKRKSDEEYEGRFLGRGGAVHRITRHLPPME